MGMTGDTRTFSSTLSVTQAVTVGGTETVTVIPVVAAIDRYAPPIAVAINVDRLQFLAFGVAAVRVRAPIAILSLTEP